jgi:hypothetical protein
VIEQASLAAEVDELEELKRQCSALLVGVRLAIILHQCAELVGDCGHVRKRQRGRIAAGPGLSGQRVGPHSGGENHRG